MSNIASKLQRIRVAKGDIKNAIENKGVNMTGVDFEDYASKISAISGGGGTTFLTPYTPYYKSYASIFYNNANKLDLFNDAWQDSQNSKTLLYDIPLKLVASNQNMGGMNVDLYVGTNGQLQALYDACYNETIPLPIDGNRDVYYVNNVATRYVGDVSDDVGFPIPIYNFGNFNADAGESFVVVDITPLQMGLGLVLGKIAGVSIPNNNIVIQQGFEFENENGIILPNSVTSIGEIAFYNWNSNNHPLVIPDSVTSIGEYAFEYWQNNNQPLVIPNSVTSIGEGAFYGWESNNQPLVIPDSVTSIGEIAFYNWNSNNHPLVIPDSVTSIGEYAFEYWQLVPYIIIHATTPPDLEHSDAFNNQNNAPIYVPHNSVATYKNATNWSALASRIKSIEEL